VTLRDAKRHIGSTSNHGGTGEFCERAARFFQRRRPEVLLSRRAYLYAAVRERCERGEDTFFHRGEMICRTTGTRSLRSIHDGAISGAAAEIPRDRVLDLPPGGAADCL